MNRRHLLTLLVASALLSACDSSAPFGPEGDADEAALEELALLALADGEAEGVPLPSFDRLLRETLQVIKTDQSSHAEGMKLLRRARHQAKLAAEAHQAGDNEAARDHTNRSRGLTLSAILLVLGDQVADQALEGVDQALARLDAKLAGKELTERIRKTLDRAHALFERGDEALASGNLRRALNVALVAADQIRSLSPRYQANKAIERATRAFRAAHEAVKANPTEVESEALGKARGHLKEAREAFEARKFREAIRHASEAGKLSLGVLQGRNVGP
jgi:HEPN domain-containing protein